VRIAVTGSRGLIGASLVPHLRSEGHEVTRIVRGKAQPDEVSWNPEEGTIEADKLRGVDAVVHLAGAGVGDHLWSAAYKKSILSSRVNGTTTLAEALSRLPHVPATEREPRPASWSR
jgi:NAD dependent epimerase/dehydratase family enzyme